MRLNIEDEKTIASYLLGDLADAEQTVVEVRFMKDAEYLETIRAIEDDLIDEYISGQLPYQQRGRFEKFFSNSPRGYKKVEVARALQALLTAEPTPEDLPRPADGPRGSSWWKLLIGSLNAHRLAFQYSLTAALVLVAFIGLWLFIDRRRQRTATESARTQNQTAPPQNPTSNQDLAVQRTREQERITSEELAKQKSAEQQRQLGKQAEAASKPAPLQPVIASFFLSPGSLRESNESTSLIVPHGASLIRLNLYLPGGANFKSYNAELRSGGNLIFSRNRLAPKSTAAGQAVTLQVPASSLAAGEYELTLFGAISKQNLKNLSSYNFSIQKK